MPPRPVRSPLLAVGVSLAGAAVVLAGCTSGEGSSSAAATAASGAAGASVASGSSGLASAPAGPTIPVAAGDTVPADESGVARDTALPTSPPAPTSRGGRSAVTVVTTYAGQDAGTVSANGYVTGVVEDGGTCTLTLTSGAGERTVSAPGIADATTTVCGGLSVDVADLAPGTWQAVLAYRSAGYEGAAGAVAVEVR